MAVYNPLFVYLTPASIPQVVAHIQKYLADNPIVSDPEAITEAIQKYIEEHPEIIAVASVNGKTGNVVLTGSDININASSAVSIETQLLNLASMISTAGADIAQINAQLETIYTNIGTIETNVSNNTSAISALQTSVEGHGTRLTTAEGDIDVLESAQTAQGTRINAAEGNISSLQTRVTQAENDIDSIESYQVTQDEDINSLKTRTSQAEDNIDNLNDLILVRELYFAGQFPANQTFTQILVNATSIDGYSIGGCVLYIINEGVSWCGINRIWYKKSDNQFDIVCVTNVSSASARTVTGYIGVLYVKNGYVDLNVGTH